jgi:hypothetical protein
VIYVEFTTNHFTDFALGESECSFVINYDDYSTESTSVLLYINCPVAIDMKFGNSEREVSRADWVGKFKDTVEWTIEGAA